MHDSTLSQNLDSLFSDLHNLVNTETVLGNPLTVGDKTLVPVMAVTVGYGTTGMGTKVQTPNAKHDSNGLGLGARISTSAVVVIDNNGVSMLPVNDKSNMGQLMEKIPQALSSMGANMMGQGQGQQQGGQQSQQGQQGQQSQQSSTSSGMQSSSSQGSSTSPTSDYLKS